MSDIQQLLPTNFIIQKNYAGYLQKMGRTAGTIYNKYALVSDKDTNEKFYVIYCYPNNITYVSKNDINKVILDDDDDKRKYVWYFHTATGYIIESKSKISLHQLLMDHLGNGKGKDSIDHINRNKLDNRRENLRITNQSIQNENCGKRSRKRNAKPLPTDLLEWLIENRDTNNLPKFVVYYSEFKDGKMIKEFFKIEKHKELEKPWHLQKVC